MINSGSVLALIFIDEKWFNKNWEIKSETFFNSKSFFSCEYENFVIPKISFNLVNQNYFNPLNISNEWSKYENALIDLKNGVASFKWNRAGMKMECRWVRNYSIELENKINQF